MIIPVPLYNRQACIDLLFSQTPLFMTREQFAKSLDGWTIDPVLRDDGNISLIFVSRGPEFHFAKFGTDLQASRDLLKKYPGELIAQHGYALTKTPKTDTRQIRFNERLGFCRVGEDEFDIHYRIDQMRKKEPSCHS